LNVWVLLTVALSAACANAGPAHAHAALIRDGAGRVLLVRKRGTTAFMQPGGKRDSGEDDVTALAREIDEEVKRIIDDAYRIAKDLIVTNHDKLELIAKSLLEFETLDGQQVEEIVRTGKFTPPPPTPQAILPRSAPT